MAGKDRMGQPGPKSNKFRPAIPGKGRYIDPNYHPQHSPSWEERLDRAERRALVENQQETVADKLIPYAIGLGAVSIVLGVGTFMGQGFIPEFPTNVANVLELASLSGMAVASFSFAILKNVSHMLRIRHYIHEENRQQNAPWN